MDQEKEYDVIEGTVSAVVYQNKDNGYTVLRLDTDDMGQVTAVGTIPLSALGERLRITGTWTTHQTYGQQMQAEFVERQMPSTADGILSYLSSRVIKGIGPKTAAAIVRKFGEASLKVIEEQYELLADLPGITMKKAKEINESFKRQVGVRLLMDYLQEYELPVRLAMKLYTCYGQSALVLIKANPYILADDYFGADFERVDRFALESGMDTDSELRLDAGVLYELQHNQTNGHTFLPRQKLVTATATLLSVSEELIDSAVSRLEKSEKLHRQTIGNADACYTAAMFEAETFVADRLTYMKDFYEEPTFNIDRVIDGIEKSNDIHYAQQQREAIKLAATSRVMLLTGGPGTGKTTTVRGIIELFQYMELKTALAAPTGRAAKRMSELCGMEATTIHRMLEAQYAGEGSETVFVHDESEPVDADAVIVDETSMVDITLARALLSALRPDCKIVFVGDPNQLPSVGAGNFLSDMIRSGKIASVSLTEVFRQAQESLIIMNAHRINRGEMPDLTVKNKDFFFMKRRSAENLASTIEELCKERLPKNMNIPSPQIQVLSPTRLGEAGTVSLNKRLQNALNPAAQGKKEKQYGQYTLREGDRVMQVKNNYDIPWTKDGSGEIGHGIFNGDVGSIESIDVMNETLYVLYEDKKAVYSFDMLGELELAYAMTVHKSQGSEYRAVILSAFSVPQMLKARNVLYTAVTRARELLIIVGDEDTIRYMVENDRQRKRYSGLMVRLRDAGN